MVKTIDRRAERARRHLRVRRKISGSASRPRLTVFSSNSHIFVQVIDDDKKHTIAASSTLSLHVRGSNVANAKTVGADIGQKLVSIGIDSIVFDRSGYFYHGKVKALAEAVREQGIKF
jgi:large subunit ribosomal protein L18